MQLIKFQTKSIFICIQILIFSLPLISTELTEKCYNGPAEYNYTIDQLDDYLYPYGGIAMQKSNLIKYGTKVQVIANHTTIDSNYSFYNRSLIFIGNSTNWMKLNSPYFFPSIKKSNCKEKLLCANSNNIYVKTCSKCNWYGQIITDMEVCRNNLLKFKEEPKTFNEFCSNYTQTPAPINSAFRSFAGSEVWEFVVVSNRLVVVDKPDLGECQPNIPNFACFDMNQNNSDIAEYYRFDAQGVLKSQGKISSGIFNREDLLVEDNYNTLKVLSQGVITVNETKFDVVDYHSGLWINSDYLVSCSSINPVDPNNPDDPDKPKDKGDLGALGIFLIIVGVLIAICGGAYGIIYFYRKKRNVSEALLG